MTVCAISDIDYAIVSENSRDLSLILSHLQEEWGIYAPASIRDFQNRIYNSDGHIIAAYQDMEFMGIFEALRIYTGGDPFRIPDTFASLTGNGTWETHQKRGDTLVAVDITVPVEHRRRGIASRLARYAKAMPGYRFTYSPYSEDFKDARALHEKNGNHSSPEV